MKNKCAQWIANRWITLEKKELPSRWSITAPILIVVIYLLSFPLIASSVKSREGILKILISPQIFFFLSLTLAFIALKIRPSELGLSANNLGKNILRGITLSLIPALLIIFFVLLPLAVYQMSTAGTLTIFNNFGKGKFSFDIFYIMQLLILAPVLEELFFRGFLIPPIKKVLPLWGVILASSLIFMLAHGYLKLGAFLLGLFTSVIFIWTGSVIPGMIFHFTSNLWGPILIFLLPEVYKIVYPLFK